MRFGSRASLLDQAARTDEEANFAPLRTRVFCPWRILKAGAKMKLKKPGHLAFSFRLFYFTGTFECSLYVCFAFVIVIRMITVAVATSYLSRAFTFLDSVTISIQYLYSTVQ